MGIYLFWSMSNVEVFGFTSDAEGTNLPDDLAPWVKNGEGLALYLGQKVDDIVASPITKAIQRDGFYLARCGHMQRRTGK